jgi:hypothetical protein
MQPDQNQPQPQNGQPQPVAYDQQGRPLYAAPPQQTQQQPQLVYMARPMEPIKQEIPEEIVKRVAESKGKWPYLNLSEGEYVISAVQRHPIGVVKIWAFVAFMILAFFAAFMAFFAGSQNDMSYTGDQSTTVAFGIAGLGTLSVLFMLGGIIATYVYNNNRFFLTNESVIQIIQTSLFSRREQTVSLANIEDASYKQNGIIPAIFNYGQIRLSTEGDETTYRFSYVTNPKHQIALLNNAVEAFKNGRPLH